MWGNVRIAYAELKWNIDAKHNITKCSVGGQMVF